MLDDHRGAMRRSLELLDRSRALCAISVEPTWLLSDLGTAASPPAVPAPLVSPACARSGCRRPALFHARLVLRFATRSLEVRDLPIHLCAAHRDHLQALARAPRFLEEFRTKLAARGREEPGALSLEFDLLN